MSNITGGVYCLADFLVINGRAYFVASSDKPVNYDLSEYVNLPGVYIYPSKDNDTIKDTFSQTVQKFIDIIGYRNGLLCLELVKFSRKFHVIEAQFRYGGKFQEVFLRQEYGLDETEMLLRHALVGDMGSFPLPLDRPFRRCYALMNILLREGTIGRVPDCGEVMKFPNVDVYIPVKEAGTRIVPDGSMIQNFGKVSFSADSREELTEAMRYFQEHIQVLDDNGSRMAIKSIGDNYV